MIEVLGFERFGAAGSDLGTWVTRSIASKYPEKVIGIHLTDVDYSLEEIPGLSQKEKEFPAMSSKEKEFARLAQQWLLSEGGYEVIQSTKPQTLAFSLQDSPVGLCAWILEKFRAWSDCKGDVENRFSKDELLTNIMIYWITGTISTSIQMYYENAKSIRESPSKFMERSEVPAAIAQFPADIFGTFPREYAERLVNVKQFTKMPRGGHFAALEEPELYTQDLEEFFAKLRDRSFLE